jgi:hypothetical protein
MHPRAPTSILLLAAIILLTLFTAGADAGLRTCTRDNQPGAGQWQPDRRYGCTPGRYDHLTRTQVCTSKDRPSLHAADRREILARYNLAGWAGRDGELDHLIPFFLGGRTTPGNIWPQPHLPGETRPGALNDKDRLENYARVRICLRHNLRPRTARRWFMGNWTRYYLKYLDQLSR